MAVFNYAERQQYADIVARRQGSPSSESIERAIRRAQSGVTPRNAEERAFIREQEGIDGRRVENSQPPPEGGRISEEGIEEESLNDAADETADSAAEAMQEAAGLISRNNSDVAAAMKEFQQCVDDKRAAAAAEKAVRGRGRAKRKAKDSPCYAKIRYVEYVSIYRVGPGERVALYDVFEGELQFIPAPRNERQAYYALYEAAYYLEFME